MLNYFNDLEVLKLTASPITSNHAPYILCNEQQQAQTLATLKPATAAETVHIGFAGLFNLDILSVTQPKYAIILDIDPNMHRIYENLEFALKQADTREDFLNTFQLALANGPSSLLPFPSEYMQQLFLKELNKAHGFLSSPEAYACIRAMVNEGRIFFGQADITDAKAMGKLDHWIKVHKLTVHTLYLSNIPEWIFEHSNSNNTQKTNMIQNLKPLICDCTHVIDAFYPSQSKTGDGPPQRITIAQLPSFLTKLTPKNIYRRIESGNSQVASSASPNNRAHTGLRLLSYLTFLPAPQDKLHESNNGSKTRPSEEESNTTSPTPEAKRLKQDKPTQF